MYVCIYIYIYTYTIVIIIIMIVACADRPRENMVGVNMVLAEYHQIQTWLL